MAKFLVSARAKGVLGPEQEGIREGLETLEIKNDILFIVLRNKIKTGLFVLKKSDLL